MPAAIPEEAKSSFKVLQAHLLAVGDAGLLDMAKTNVAQVETTTLGHTPWQWLVLQSFDTRTEFVNMIAQCCAVPVLGVAIPLDNTTSGARADGSVFCFLPVGDIVTGLPVHLNASFNLTKNRRSMWRNTSEQSSIGLVGQQHTWAAWNDVLLTQALPDLWAVGLERLCDHMDAHSIEPATIFSCLPDLDQVPTEWQPCAAALYKVLWNRKVLPHQRNRSMCWVAPIEANGLLEVSNGSLYSKFKALYQCSTGGKLVVFAPKHTLGHLLKYSQLPPISIVSALETVNLKLVDSVKQMSSTLLALAEYVSTLSSSAQQAAHIKWAKLLTGLSWVPLCGGGFGELTSSFASNQQLEPLSGMIFDQVAQIPTVGLDGAAVIESCLAW